MAWRRHRREDPCGYPSSGFRTRPVCPDVEHGPFGVAPERFGCLRDRAHAGENLLLRDAGGAPRAAITVHVLQERLQPVDRMSEARLRRSPILELIPERTQLRGLVVGQQAEDAVRRDSLARLSRRAGLRIVSERIAGIDLDEVVHDEHTDDVREIDSGWRLLVQEHRHQREMPGMLGAVLPSRPVRQLRPAQHRLEPVGLDEKAELPFEPCVGGRLRTLPFAHRPGPNPIETPIWYVIRWAELRIAVMTAGCPGSKSIPSSVT